MRLLTAVLSATAIAAASLLSSLGGAPASHPNPLGVTVQQAAAPDAAGSALFVRWTSSTRPHVTGYDVTAAGPGGGTTVSRHCAAGCTSALLTNLHEGRRYTVTVTVLGTHDHHVSTSTVGPVTTRALAHPKRPTAAEAVEIPGTDQLRVTWQPDTTADAAQWFHVLYWDVTSATSPTFVGQRQCNMRCTSTVLDLLSDGHRYTVAIAASNPAGGSALRVAASGLPIDTGCPVTACLSADATRPTGTEHHPGEGFLNGLVPSSDPDQLAALKPSWWRLGTGSVSAPRYVTFDKAKAAGAKIVNLLSSDWHAATAAEHGGYAEAPWSHNWRDYRTFVTAKVRADLRAGRSPDVWEVQNEPAGGSYLAPADRGGFTVQRQLQQFLVAYDAIRSVDPDALVAGPASVYFATQSDLSTSSPPEVDLRTFLRFCQQHHVQLGALTWHENLDGGRSIDLNGQPAALEEHIAEARRLLASFEVGHPRLLITEYLGPITHVLPGWAVGDLAAFDATNIDGAMRACWWNPDDGLLPSDCAGGALDGLLRPEGTSLVPTALYRTYRTYARMTGERVALASSDTSVTGLATTDGQGLRVLVGRHWSCDVGHNLLCPLLSPQRGPATTRLHLKLPSAGTYRLKVIDITYDATTHPGSSVNSAAPSRVTTDAHGWATFTLDGLGDGNARSIVLTPAG